MTKKLKVFRKKVWNSERSVYEFAITYEPFIQRLKSYGIFENLIKHTTKNDYCGSPSSVDLCDHLADIFVFSAKLSDTKSFLSKLEDFRCDRFICNYFCILG